MSYDACRLCGKQAPKPYMAMEECCERDGCPGVKRRDFFRDIFPAPKRLPEGETASPPSQEGGEAA